MVGDDGEPVAARTLATLNDDATAPPVLIPVHSRIASTFHWFVCANPTGAGTAPM
jgi:hypothetical protein